MSLKNTITLTSVLLLSAPAVSQQFTFDGAGCEPGHFGFTSGLSWEDITPVQMAGNGPLSVTTQPGNPDRIVVSSALEGVYVTSNGGHNWHHNYLDFDTGPYYPSWWVNDVIFRPTAPNEALAMTMSGTFWSDDGGLHWFATNGQRPEGSIQAVSSDDGTVAVAGGIFGDIWVYDWNSRTWTQRNSNSTTYLVTGVDLDLNGELYITHDTSPVLTSPDYGLTTYRFGNGLPQFTAAHDPVCDPQIPERAMLVSDNRLWVTNEGPNYQGGGRWHETGLGLPGTDILSLIHHPTWPNVMFAGLVDHGVYVSIDRGYSWHPLGTDGMHHTSVVDLSISEDDPSWLIAASHSGASTDGGVYRLRLRKWM